MLEVDFARLLRIVAEWLGAAFDSGQVLWPVIAVTATVALVVVLAVAIGMAVRLYRIDERERWS